MAVGRDRGQDGSSRLVQERPLRDRQDRVQDWSSRLSCGHARDSPAADPPRDQPTDRGGPRRDSLEVRDDRVVGEAPLEIRAAGPRQDPVAVAVTMRTPATRRSSRSGSCGPEGLLEGQRGRRHEPAATRVAQPARRHDRRAAVAPVRRLEGRRAPFRRDGVVRDLRQGLDRRGRPARRAARPRGRSSRARSSWPCPTCSGPPSGPSTRPAGSMRPACSPRGRAPRAPRGRRAPQRPRQAGRLAGPRPARCRSTTGS